jgi:signal transduction histidine kinase
MKSLVDSLLVLAKADAGRLTLERTSFNLEDIAAECATMVAPLAQEKGVTLTTDLHPAELVADPTRIAQVITNLLTNAIRYNREHGTVHVALTTTATDAILTVADTGMGIPFENQPHIFERFYRVDTARSRELGGSGLGLSICKSIIESHNGSISFTSQPGQGTTFSLRLPLHPAPHPPANTPQS